MAGSAPRSGGPGWACPCGGIATSAAGAARVQRRGCASAFGCPGPRAGAPTSALPGSEHLERRGVVEVAAAFGLPLSGLSALAVAALAGPLDLGRGPLQAGPDLGGLQLGDRPLVALGGLPAALPE